MVILRSVNGNSEECEEEVTNEEIITYWRSRGLLKVEIARQIYCLYTNRLVPLR
jgi:hypothetical protein